MYEEKICSLSSEGTTALRSSSSRGRNVLSPVASCSDRDLQKKREREEFSFSPFRPLLCSAEKPRFCVRCGGSILPDGLCSLTMGDCTWRYYFGVLFVALRLDLCRSLILESIYWNTTNSRYVPEPHPPLYTALLW